MNRRTYLVGLAAGLVGTAGCMQSSDSGDAERENDRGGSGGVVGTVGLSMASITDTEIVSGHG